MKYLGNISDPKDFVNKEYVDNITDTKANIDGAYENMTVGNAEQLVSTVFVNDKVPYTFRTSGGSADIGDREYDTIVGGTVAWNQLWPQPDWHGGSGIATSGGTRTIADGQCTIVANSPNEPVKLYSTGNFVIPVDRLKNHIFLITAVIQSNIGCEIKPTGFGADGNKLYDTAALLTPTRVWFVWKPKDTIEQTATWMIASRSGSGVTSEMTISNYCVFDLTLMFGSNAANYIHSLEQSTEGAGYNWFRKLFPKPWYTYNTGALLDVNVSEHQTTGVNQWDEEWESGRYNQTTGAKESSSSTIRSKNNIKVIPNTVYYFCASTSGGYLYYYDINGNYLGTRYDIVANNTFTTPAEAYYMTFSMYSGYGTTYLNDICISLYWDGERAGEYEPYVLHSYPLDSTLTLRGVPKLDENNQLYYDGDIYEPDGTVTRRYGVVDLGTLNWRYYESAYFSDSITGKAAGVDNFIQPKFSVVLGTTAANLPDKSMRGSPNNSSIFIKDESFNGDYTAFKAAMSGIYLVYELETPTTETADPFQSPQIVDDWGTERYVVTAQGDVEVPVGHDTNYANNLRAKLEMAPESPSGDGDYIVRQTSGQNVYVPLVFPVDELPVTPSEDGSYTLQVTISGGTATYSWVSA